MRNDAHDIIDGVPVIVLVKRESIMTCRPTYPMQNMPVDEESPYQESDYLSTLHCEK